MSGVKHHWGSNVLGSGVWGSNVTGGQVSPGVRCLSGSGVSGVRCPLGCWGSNVTGVERPEVRDQGSNVWGSGVWGSNGVQPIFGSYLATFGCWVQFKISLFTKLHVGQENWLVPATFNFPHFLTYFWAIF